MMKTTTTTTTTAAACDVGETTSKQLPPLSRKHTQIFDEDTVNLRFKQLPRRDN